jgi:hypothetical protein
MICCSTVHYQIVIGQMSMTKFSVDSAVYNFTASVFEAIDEAIPSVPPNTSAFTY